MHRAKFLCVSIVLMALLSGCASAGEPSLSAESRYKVYSDICNELEAQYGKCEEVHSVEGDIDHRYLKGLCYAELIDLGSDGQEELIVAYRVGDRYQVEVLSCDAAGKCNRYRMDASSSKSFTDHKLDGSRVSVITSEAAIDGEENMPVILLSEMSGIGNTSGNGRYEEVERDELTKVFTLGSGNDLEQIVSYQVSERSTYDNNASSTSNYFLGESSYRVDGSTVDRDEFFETYDKYRNNVMDCRLEEITYDASPGDLAEPYGFGDSLTETADSTKETLEKLAA